MKLYPLAPLHDGGMHTDLPTIEPFQLFSCHNIPAQVKRQKCYRKPPEDIIRAILIDSERFYNPNRRRHRREYTSTGTKLIYHNVGGPKQRKRMRSFLWDSDWRHGPESPDVESSVFEPSFHSVLPPSPEEEVVFKYSENSEKSRLSPRSKAQAELDSTLSPSMLPTEHDFVSFWSSQSSLQHSHGSTLPRFDEGENEPTNLTVESPKSLKLWKFQVNSSNRDNSREYSQDSLDSKVWKQSGGQRDTHASGSSSSSSDSSSSVPHEHQVRTQYNHLLEY